MTVNSPLVAGPILRKVTRERVVIWLVSQQEQIDQLQINGVNYAPQASWQSVQIGARAWVHLLDCQLDSALPEDQWLHYHIYIQQQCLLLALLQPFDPTHQHLLLGHFFPGL